MKAIRIVLACIRKADETYNLIHDNDEIVIGVSGGKDSMALLYALNIYRHFSKKNFKIVPIILDLGFPGFDPTNLKEYVSSLGLELIVHDSKEVYKILSIQQKNMHQGHLPCSICSRMKKAAINKASKDLGLNKVAFAHHADDAIETLFLNEIYGGKIATFAPKMHLENADIEFIRPLINVREDTIKRLVKEENIFVMKSSCPADGYTKREDIKKLLSQVYSTFEPSKSNFLTMLSNYEKEDIFYSHEQLIVNEEIYLVPVTDEKKANIESKIYAEVFIDEFKFYPTSVFDGDQNKAERFLIYQGSQAIGTIKYEEENRAIHIKRFAILKDFRNKGVGSAVFLYIESRIAEIFNPCTIIVECPTFRLSYYQKFSFIDNKKDFVVCNIPHKTLSKNIK